MNIELVRQISKDLCTEADFLVRSKGKFAVTTWITIESIKKLSILLKNEVGSETKSTGNNREQAV